MVAAVDAGGTFPLLSVAVVSGELDFSGVEASKAVSEGKGRNEGFKRGGHFCWGISITVI